MSKVQFEKTRQDDGRVFDVVKVGVRGQEGLFGEIHSDIPQPKDEGILLKDILEEEVDEKYYLSEKGIAGMLKHKENNTNNGNGFGVQFIIRETDKSNSILQRGYKDCKDNAVCVAMRGRNPDNPSDRTSGSPTEQRLEPNLNGKTNTITTVKKDNVVMLTPINEKKIASKGRIRQMTTSEIEMCQTLPAGYTKSVPKRKGEYMVGRGWTVDVIAHILSHM
ncbi:MAG: DNA cytosine methyltransferase [Clostridia bacterium]